MKRSPVEKKSVLQTVNTVEISVNTVVIKTIDILIPIKFLSKHCHTFVDYKCLAVNKQLLMDHHQMTLLISHILDEMREYALYM